MTNNVALEMIKKSLQEIEEKHPDFFESKKLTPRFFVFHDIENKRMLFSPDRAFRYDLPKEIEEKIKLAISVC